MSSVNVSTFPVRVGLCQGCPMYQIMFVVFMNRISSSTLGEESVRFKDLRKLVADDVFFWPRQTVTSIAHWGGLQLSVKLSG